MRSLFYGYGNPGRRDDGLGVLCSQELERWCREKKISGWDFDTNYQLNIEDADTISHYDLVIFCDASQEEIPPFCVTKVEPSEARIEFSMHAVSPAFILDLSKKLFHATPETWLLHLKGVDWEFREGLSPVGQENLNTALGFLKGHLITSSKPGEILANSRKMCP